MLHRVSAGAAKNESQITTQLLIMIRISQSKEFRWLGSRVKPFLRLFVGSYLCIALASTLVLIEPLIVRHLIDDVIPNRRIGWLPPLAAAFFLTYMGRLGFDSLGAMLNFRAVQKMTFRLRLSLLRHLQRLSAEYHDNKPLGDTLHRLQVDVEQVGTLSGEVIPSALRMLTVFSLVMTTMLVINYRLTAIVLPLIPVFILVRQRFRNRLRQASDSVQEQSGKVIGFLQEHLSAIVQVQLLSCEQREARRFARLAGHAVRAQIKRRATELFFSSFLYLIIVMGMASVLCYGGYQVMTGALTAGGLVAFDGILTPTLRKIIHHSHTDNSELTNCHKEGRAPERKKKVATACRCDFTASRIEKLRLINC
jgi:ABC-type bacteriocin/lantibiotic exporter with double-glycine peptidase domain